jgi:hypothetical protein
VQPSPTGTPDDARNQARCRGPPRLGGRNVVEGDGEQRGGDVFVEAPARPSFATLSVGLAPRWW